MNAAASASYRAASELPDDDGPEPRGCAHCQGDHAAHACPHRHSDGRGPRPCAQQTAGRAS